MCFTNKRVDILGLLLANFSKSWFGPIPGALHLPQPIFQPGALPGGHNDPVLRGPPMEIIDQVQASIFHVDGKRRAGGRTSAIEIRSVNFRLRGDHPPPQRAEI